MDRMTKLLMAAIAAGLFANAAMQAIRSAHANEETDGYALGQIATELGDIKRQICSLTEGTCQNHKLLLNARKNHQTTKTVNATAKSIAMTFNNKLLIDLCSAMAVSGRIDSQPQDTTSAHPRSGRCPECATADVAAHCNRPGAGSNIACFGRGSSGSMIRAVALGAHSDNGRGPPAAWCADPV